MVSLEDRMRKIDFLETNPSSAFLPKASEPAVHSEIAGNFVPFIERGIPFIQLLPSPLPPTAYTMEDNGGYLDLFTVRDWAKIVTGFALE